MKPLPKIRKLGRTVEMFNQGCATYKKALQALEQKNFPRYETGLLSAARDVPDALEGALKIYLRRLQNLAPEDRAKLKEPTFYHLVRLMKSYADPSLDREAISRFQDYRSMRNESTHKGALPSLTEVEQAITEIRQLMLTYLPLEDEHLSQIPAIQPAPAAPYPPLPTSAPAASPKIQGQNIVFISYSHNDEAEKERLLSHLRVVEQAGLIDVWSDDRIGAGADWQTEIERAITQAKVAILLISTNFLTSNFILNKEVPALLQRCQQAGLIVYPIIAKACAWRTVSWLTQMNVRPKNGRPVWSGPESQVDADLATVAEEIAKIFQPVLLDGMLGPSTPKPREGARIYRDFNLCFSSYDPAGGSFKVWVEGETPGGMMKFDDTARCIFDPKAFWKNPAIGQGGLVGKLDKRQIKRDQLFALGRQLADLALPQGPVRNLFQQSLAALKDNEGLRLRLCIDSVELAHLPWEYLALSQAGEPHETDFLALRREISIVRTNTIVSPIRILPDRNHVQVAGIFASPYDQEIDIDREKAILDEAVGKLNKAAEQDLIAVKWSDRPANREVVRQILSGGADIFHYAGPAIYDKADQADKIILEGEGEDNEYDSDPYSSEQLAQLLHDAGIRLAMLEVCEAGRRDGQNIWNGVALALTRQRIPAVIANQFRILDKNAVWLVAKVYHRVLAGYTIDEALFEARQTIYQQNDLENHDWGVPVLYLHDQTGVLFPLSKAGPDEAKAAAAPEHPFIRVANTFNTIKGEVIDVQIEKMERGHLEIESAIDLVDEDGSYTGLKINKLG